MRLVVCKKSLIRPWICNRLRALPIVISLHSIANYHFYVGNYRPKSLHLLLYIQASFNHFRYRRSLFKVSFMHLRIGLLEMPPSNIRKDPISIWPATRGEDFFFGKFQVKCLWNLSFRSALFLRISEATHFKSAK
jgi:hypothetical protein